MKKKRKLWKTLAIASGVALLLLLLFVVAFVFNPLEGSLVDVRDVVPREVDFFLRKTHLTADFAGADGRFHLVRDELPAPLFWSTMTDTDAWRAVSKGPLVTGLARDYTGILRQARDGLLNLQEGSGGMLDLARDLIGSELVMAGYLEDKTKQPFQPLAQPWWCLYARVSWRIRCAWGLANWSLVQNRAREQGVDVTPDGEFLVIKAPGGGGTFYAARRLDCLMIANNKHLLEQSVRLADGNIREEGFGLTARYTEGITNPVARWSEVNSENPQNAFEFSVAPNSIDGFRKLAMTWPNENNKDSMNERVLASFLKLAGWTFASGALLFEPQQASVPPQLSLCGRIELNSNLHTKFQAAFYQGEKQPRDQWLDPFLRMVPESACAAACLSVRAGEFLRAMYGALLPTEKSLLNDAMRQCTYSNTSLTGCEDLIDKLAVAFQPRTGFVFRRNVRDPQIAVGSPSPVPQIAWIFWLKQGGRPIVEELVAMLRRHAAVFHFDPVYHLKVEELPEPVTEFCEAQIPGTGEIAMIVFSDFFVLSNSGPLSKDIVRARYDYVHKLVQSPWFDRVQRELPKELNGFIWLRSENLLPVLDDYRKAAEDTAKDPDPDWMAQRRGEAEQAVLAEKYPNNPTKASLSEEVRQGEFEQAVGAKLREMWTRSSAGASINDLPQIEQWRALARLFDTAYLQVELQNNYIRFQGKVIANF